jgi:hypothetical protein
MVGLAGRCALKIEKIQGFSEYVRRNKGKMGRDRAMPGEARGPRPGEGKKPEHVFSGCPGFGAVLYRETRETAQQGIGAQSNPTSTEDALVEAGIALANDLYHADTWPSMYLNN